MSSIDPVKNRIILGLMTFGPEEATEARITQLSEFQRCLDHFQAQSYHELDTARMYLGGQQEAFTAKARWRERGLKLATKVSITLFTATGKLSSQVKEVAKVVWRQVYPVQPGDHKPAALAHTLTTSLDALETDQVDILYLHAPDRSVPFAETLKAVDQLHRAGKFVQFGLSNFTAFEIAEIVMTCHTNGWLRPTICQAMYNVITRTIEAELIPACRRYGLELVVYNPLAGGLFSGKYSMTNIPTIGRFSADSSQQGSQYRRRYFRDEYFEALAMIEPVAKQHELTLIEIAMRWLVHHSALNTAARTGGTDGVIIGVSSFDQLESNMQDLEKGPLPQEILGVLDRAWRICKAEAPDYWQNIPLEYAYDTQKAIFGR